MKLAPGLYVSPDLADRARELGLAATVVDDLVAPQWLLVTDDGEHQPRDVRYPCRRCRRCPGFGYEPGDHPGICFCRHDDSDHGPRRSALRRWLRSMAAEDNMARIAQEEHDKRRADEKKMSRHLSEMLGRPVTVRPSGFTTPFLAYREPPPLDYAATGIVKGSHILADASRQRFQVCRRLLRTLEPAEREELLDRVDALPDDRLAAAGERLCLFCLASMRADAVCPNGCRRSDSWYGARELPAYYRNRRAVLASPEPRQAFCEDCGAGLAWPLDQPVPWPCGRCNE